MIVDFHTHVFPDAIAARAVDKLRASSHTRAFTDGTAAGLRASMARAGVDASLVLPVATGAKQVPHVNDASVQLNERGPETGVYSFGCIHPDFSGWRDELSRIAGAGLKGIKIHPPYQGADFDDVRFLRVLERCGELGLIVITHAGLDVGLPGAEQSTPEKILRAVRAVGPVTLVLAHMGGWRCWTDVERLLPGTGVYLDTSFSLGPMTPGEDGFYQDEASLARLTAEDFMRMIRLFGADHILFGTDSPWDCQTDQLRQLCALPLSAEEKSLILGGNAQRLLGTIVVPPLGRNGKSDYNDERNGREART